MAISFSPRLECDCYCSKLKQWIPSFVLFFLLCLCFTMRGIFSSLELASWIKICWKIREKKILLKPPRFLFPIHSPLQCWISLKCKCIYFTLNCPSNISWFWSEEVEFTRRSKIHRPLWSKLCQIVYGVVVKVFPKSGKRSPLHNDSGWICTLANERAKQIPIWHRRCFCSLIFSQESSEED